MEQTRVLGTRPVAAEYSRGIITHKAGATMLRASISLIDNEVSLSCHVSAAQNNCTEKILYIDVL